MTILAARAAGNVVLIVVAPVAAAASVLMIALGVAARKLAQRLRPTPFRGTSVLHTAAAIGLALALLPYAVAWVAKHRMARVDRPPPLVIDERRGAISRVGLGDSTTRALTVFGRPLSRRQDAAIGTARSGDEDFFLGPGFLPQLHGKHDMIYRDVFFAAQGSRIRYIEITEPRARLTRGYGPGDSISFIHHAYHRLTCDEGDAGHDEPVPYPRCHGEIAPHVWAYISGTYAKPGAPITEIWLGDFPLDRDG